MQDIEEKIYKNYEDNIEFFKEKFPRVYSRILALETLLQDGRYPQKYELEYNDSYFDVVELKSGAKLYAQNSEKFSKELCDQVTYRKDDQVFQSYRKYKVSDEDAKLIKDAPAFLQFSSIAEIINFYNNHNKDDMHLTQIEKYIFLGAGLGLHIPKIVDKYDIQVIWIIEDDIELFRLSLFAINYKETFANRILYLSIDEDLNELEINFTNFFQKAFFKNRYIKFTIFSSLYENKIDLIRSFLVGRAETVYANERLLLKNSKVVENITNGYKFFDVRKKHDDKFFQDKPILVLGAGPSLDYNKEWIAKNQDRFIIIAAFSALKTLRKIGVVPDIVVHIDEDEEIIKKMIYDIGSLEFIEDSLMFFSASVSRYLIEQFDKDKIYLHEDRTRYKLSKSTMQVTSVGDTIYALSLILNAKEIYLIGLDLALSFEGETHTKEHSKGFSIEEEKRKNKEEDFQFFNQKIKVKGNLKDTVETIPIFMQSIPIINLKTRTLKDRDQCIYNLSQNGVYLSDTIPTNTKEVKLPKKMNKKEVSSELKEFFDRYSSNQLSAEEYDYIFKREKQIEEFYDFVEEFKNAPTTPKENFLRSFIDVVSKPINHHLRYELWEIFYIYGMRLGPYIDDLMYTKEIKLRKKELKELKEIIHRKYKQQIDVYKEILNYLNIE